MQQAKNLFSSNAPGTLRIGSATFTEVPNAGNAAMFSGATDAQVQQYFMELTGPTQLPVVKVIPGKGALFGEYAQWEFHPTRLFLLLGKNRGSMDH
ncbi:hypothetical protein ACQUJS_24105 [Ralstonia pseudosolanacearum]